MQQIILNVKILCIAHQDDTKFLKTFCNAVALTSLCTLIGPPLSLWLGQPV